MTISACLIAKEADDDLARCLRSLKGQVDQVVVVCAPDQAGKMKERLRVRDLVVPFAWCDDFSAARNAGIERATGDWLFVIDTDEVLDGDLRQLCELVPAGIDGVWVTCMSYADELGNIGMASRSCRIMRNGIGARYEGRIHEQLLLADRPPVMATQDGVTVFHWGYLPEHAAGKRVQRLRILRAELNDHPDNAFAHFNLGVQHGIHGDYPEAMAPLQEAIRLWQADPQPLAWLSALFTSAIFTAIKTGDLDQAITIAGQAPKEAFTPDYFYYTAMASWDRGFKDDALGLLERGLAAPIDPHFHEASIPGRIREALEALRA